MQKYLPAEFLHSIQLFISLHTFYYYAFQTCQNFMRPVAKYSEIAILEAGLFPNWASRF
jgi:hypothetical protein